MQTLEELFKELGKDKNQLIGIYEGKGKKIYPDFADELLETHGDRIVIDYAITSNNILVVELEEE